MCFLFHSFYLASQVVGLATLISRLLDNRLDEIMVLVLLLPVLLQQFEIVHLFRLSLWCWCLDFCLVVINMFFRILQILQTDFLGFIAFQFSRFVSYTLNLLSEGLSFLGVNFWFEIALHVIAVLSQLIPNFLCFLGLLCLLLGEFGSRIFLLRLSIPRAFVDITHRIRPLFLRQ
jgi:hypothetical protein